MNTTQTLPPFRYRWMVGFCFTLVLVAWASPQAAAQITVPRPVPSAADRYTKLEDLLINRLHATATDQQTYIRFVVNKVRTNELDLRLVIAVQQYAIKRNPQLPFFFFERAMKVEAGKRGVVLPPVREFATVSSPSL